MQKAYFQTPTGRPAAVPVSSPAPRFPRAVDGDPGGAELRDGPTSAWRRVAAGAPLPAPCEIRAGGATLRILLGDTLTAVFEPHAHAALTESVDHGGYNDRVSRVACFELRSGAMRFEMGASDGPQRMRIGVEDRATGRPSHAPPVLLITPKAGAPVAPPSPVAQEIVAIVAPPSPVAPEIAAIVAPPSSAAPPPATPTLAAEVAPTIEAPTLAAEVASIAEAPAPTLVVAPTVDAPATQPAPALAAPPPVSDPPSPPVTTPDLPSARNPARASIPPSPVVAMTAPGGSPSSLPPRIHPRLEVQAEVTLQSEHNFFAGLTENISEGGIFVATHSLKRIGEHVAIELTLPGYDRPIRADSEVRWVRVYNEASDAPPGMGLCFVDLSEADAEAVSDFIRQRAPIFFE